MCENGAEVYKCGLVLFIYFFLVYCWGSDLDETQQRQWRVYCANILQNTSITWIVKLLRPAQFMILAQNKTSAENNLPLNTPVGINGDVY